jgi:hypothetical protein
MRNKRKNRKSKKKRKRKRRHRKRVHKNNIKDAPNKGIYEKGDKVEVRQP